jgi:hypothetical protein
VDVLRDDRGIDELLTGLTLTPVQRADDNFVKDVRMQSLNCCNIKELCIPRSFQMQGYTLPY